jgi:hypothetical protein
MYDNFDHIHHSTKASSDISKIAWEFIHITFKIHWNFRMGCTRILKNKILCFCSHAIPLFSQASIWIVFLKLCRNTVENVFYFLNYPSYLLHDKTCWNFLIFIFSQYVSTCTSNLSLLQTWQHLQSLHCHG